MKRVGYQIHYYNLGRWTPLLKVYLSKKAAYKAKKDYLSENNETKNIKLIEIEVIEDDESIDNFYDQIEKEDSNWQAELQTTMQEAINEIEAGNTKKIEPGQTKEWLQSLAKEALEEDKYWLTKISICGGD